MVYWLLKLKFLSSSPAADTEIKAEHPHEDVAFQGAGGNAKKAEAGVCECERVCRPGWYLCGRRRGREAGCEVCVCLRSNGSGSPRLSLCGSEVEE